MWWNKIGKLNSISPDELSIIQLLVVNYGK